MPKKYNSAVLFVKINIKDYNIQDTASKVTVVNNIGHSMWEAIRMTINDKEITTSGGLYPYKAYISNCLTYDNWVKDSQLNAQGWYGDSANHMEAENGNDGFDLRNNLFREDFDANNNYRKDGASFFTRLHHDLITCESGLPPVMKTFKQLNVKYHCAVDLLFDWFRNAICVWCT